MTVNGWETVIGLEVHCELATDTKLFCGCPNDFGAEPNTYVCPVCLGLPGSLPVLNERAVEFALRVGEALHCDVPAESIFHRKNYFYPDMPKNFQISQYDEPVCGNGWMAVPIPDGTVKRVGIERAHLEEDTGKTSHVGGGGGRIHGADHSLVDYNRAGVPLLEIVSKPDLRSPEEARAYVAELRGVLEAIGVSDVKMEEGSLRVDANISLRPAGSETLGTRAEIKNMNSLRSLARALEYEAQRQAAVTAGLPGSGRDVTNWVTGDLLAHLKETGAAPAALPLSPGGLAELVRLVADGTLSRPLAKEVLGAALAGEGGGSPAAIVAERGLAQVSDEGELVAAVRAVLDAHPAEVERYRGGEDKDRKKLRGFFMGKVMAEMKGRGNPQVLNRLLDETLAG